MSEIIYSHPAYIFNAPDPENTKVEFVYNFYERDETSKHFSGSFIQENISFESEYRNRYKINFSEKERIKISKYNKISWSISGYKKWSERSDGTNPLLFSDMSKILSEESIPFNSFEPIIIPGDQTPARYFSLANFLNSQVTTSDILNFGLSDKVQSFDINQPLGENGEIPRIFSQENLNIVMNKKFNFDLFEETISDPLSPLEDEIFSILRNPSEEEDYKNTELLNFIPNIGETSELKDPALVGYLISKFEVLSNGSLQEFPKILVKNPQLSEIIDIDVIYGKTYLYKVKSVFLITLPVLEVENTGISFIKCLISSRSTDQYINCEEKTPPPPPQDIEFFWREGEGLMICWNLHQDTQKDIKRIQIFRRETIHNPFELLKEIRFNDNTSREVLTGVPENIPDELIHVANKPYDVKFLIDDDFDINKKFIYSLCSIDAHFYTSNYSMQFEVSYDKVFNKLNVKFISGSGAPKPYPNLFLESEEIVLNSLTENGKRSKRVKIIFSPQFLKCFHENSEVQIDQLKILKEELGSYNIQIINLDNQKKFGFDFKIKDRAGIL